MRREVPPSSFIQVQYIFFSNIFSCFHCFHPETVHALDSDGETTKGKEEKGKKEEKKEGEEEEEKGFRLGPSDFLDSLKGGEKEFTGM